MFSAGHKARAMHGGGLHAIRGHAAVKLALACWNGHRKSDRHLHLEGDRALDGVVCPLTLRSGRINKSIVGQVLSFSFHNELQYIHNMLKPNK